ncbi:hypothetical protein AVKW3434_02970 [Acidovorax sp. SUPP3434]|uniref:hypothetical protein n=1 Tax=Acidovorax sp. SUPP3434 TaxID=2920880 RepID=UPI0023DE46D5|nr:hypothetical protein [Acidovorax sp. SUPP3434]GKS98304.1 hypothetical protein AVKW3434_02970 [Acidovorax sp. SUPP3434]
MNTAVSALRCTTAARVDLCLLIALPASADATLDGIRQGGKLVDKKNGMTPTLLLRQLHEKFKKLPA